ncbi:MAG: hypothetical protein GXP08_06880 [Gammaproteobacteria bacterium]|nr:hypothetical protein [Gammaproteobacteria bacterium]
MSNTNTVNTHSTAFTIARFRALQAIIFMVGLSAMAVSGWYLIEGMLHFAGDDAAKRVFIAAGIIFQITESICFISAAALTSKSTYWRISLFLLGVILFIFSITVMTLAQKALLQSGENQASALDEKIAAINAQVESLDEMIAAYQLNAKKQSQSIYASSRELGQDSLNRATELEEKKLALSNQLFSLNNARKQTSGDFFQQLEILMGLSALKMELYFLISRSLLLELCGVVLMAFAAHLKLPQAMTKKERPTSIAQTEQHSRHQQKSSTSKSASVSVPLKEINAPTLLSSGHWASSHIRSLKQKTEDTDT